jgi:periplasmic divalent cation tolerance protein
LIGGEGEFILVTVTAPDEAEAGRIARAVVEERLAACCNIVPGLRSIYHWQGKVCDSPEALMIFKTRKSLFGALKDRVVSLHTYDVPEVISFDISAGHADYLAWLGAETLKDGRP